MIKKHDFLNRKILWNEEKKAAFGPYEKVKKIAQSKNGKEKDVKQVDINMQIIASHISLNVDVFFGEAMHRQVAKIAYEWYCLKNKVEDRYHDFSDIIDYILNGNNNQVVKMVTDETLLAQFQDFCNNGSHCIMAYLDYEDGISVLVDMFGVAVYDVKVCRHIPDFCKYNCALQKINIDGTGNRENECLCVHDYNDLVLDMLVGTKENEEFPEEKCGDHHDIFYYYILYKLGENEIEELNDEIVQEFIIKLFGTRNIDSKEIDIREKLKEMLQCEKYNELIKKGAEKIRK